MGSTKEEVLEFIEKCEQLKKSKFIMATTRIKDILKSIVNSAALYELFNAVTVNFDYISAKRKYIINQQEGILNKSRLILPDTIGERLAFIFCLMVEFDHDTINFNQFLRQYFAVDGSYFSSFRAFCDKVIVSLEDMISDIFRDELSGDRVDDTDLVGAENLDLKPSKNENLPENSSDPAAAKRITAISILIAREKNIISCSEMSEADKQDGIALLNELEGAVREERYRTVDAILRGYEYYSDCHNKFSQLINLLSSAVES